MTFWRRIAQKLQKSPGIGQAIAEKIVEYRETKKIRELERLKSGFPAELLKLLEIPGIGPKTLKILWFEFQVQSLKDLKRVLESGKLEERPGFGVKKVENLRGGMNF